MQNPLPHISRLSHGNSNFTSYCLFSAAGNVLFLPGAQSLGHLLWLPGSLYRYHCPNPLNCFLKFGSRLASCRETDLTLPAKDPHSNIVRKSFGSLKPLTAFY